MKYFTDIRDHVGPIDNTKLIIKCVIVSFKIIGGSLFAVGVWAWSEKEMFQKFGQMIPLDHALYIFIIFGLVIFVIGFCGCIDALGENEVFLLTVSIKLYNDGIILILNLTEDDCACICNYVYICVCMRQNMGHRIWGIEGMYKCASIVMIARP